VARNRVAFQGARGAFSEDAARQMLGDAITFKPCERFEEVFQSLASGDVNAAVVPIENTLHGSIHENYDHLLDFKLPIVGEARVRIVHNLIGRPEATLSKVKTAISHPVALRQCLTFFKQHKRIRSEIYYDTAGSVNRIMEEDDPSVAAIASAMAAKYYGAKLLKKSIEDDRQNYTRFFLLKQKAPKRPAKKGVPLKTSIVFTTPNKPATLFRCMSAFALRDINLDKIESRPFRGRPFEYLFYLDFLGSPDDPNCRNAMSHLREITDFVAVLGCYPQAA
jgi:prephenate dehydratase